VRMFLIVGFGVGTKIKKGEQLWKRFEVVKDRRNQITHPRKPYDIILAAAYYGGAS